MDITFEEYRKENKDVLLKLTNKLEKYIKKLDPIKRVKNLPGFSEYSFKETLENVKNNQGKIWLAKDGNKFVGFITGVIWKQSEKNKLELGPHKVGEVLDIFLEEGYRGKGIGRKMLTMMENYFKEKGCDSIWIEVFEPNRNAVSVYENFGFIKREIGLLKEI